MKRMENRSIKIIGLLLIAFLLQACQQEKKYEIGNRGNVDIIDRAVVLNRAEVSGLSCRYQFPFAGGGEGRKRGMGAIAMR